MTVPHVKWLVDSGKKLTTHDGADVAIWELRHIDDGAILSAWANHFRLHYCTDQILDGLRAGTGLSRTEYLLKHKFPKTTGLGPSVRAGDFAEILIADFIEFNEGYWCPRERYALKWNTDESTKGSDVVGFKFTKKSGHSPKDEMYVLESKTNMSKSKKNRFEEAVKDSGKDPVRYAASLNALKQRFLEKTDNHSAQKIQRFQDAAARPFTFRSGAVLVCSVDSFDPELIKATAAKDHPNAKNLTLIVVTGEALMDLVHALYQRAANEA